MPDTIDFKVHTDANAGASIVTIQKWGGLASFMLVLGFIVAPLIYLTGNLKDPIGAFAYEWMVKAEERQTTEIL